MLGIEEIGVQVEEPFSILPLEALCNGAIAATLEEMVGAERAGDLKAPVPPVMEEPAVEEPAAEEDEDAASMTGLSVPHASTEYCAWLCRCCSSIGATTALGAAASPSSRCV